MALDSDTRDRLIILEEQLHSHTDRFEKMADKVDKMYDLMNQAKGAKWTILGFAGITGFFGGKFGSVVLAMLGTK